MGTGILICGLNGCGKTTLGKALAKEIGFHFFDNESLFFSRTQDDQPYTNPRTHEEAEILFAQEVGKHENFVFAAVTGRYGNDVNALYQYVILIEAPKEIRLRRVRNRSFRKFGSRMLQGGDLYESEENFFKFVENRPEDHVENWVKTLKCPVIRVDGTKTVEETVAFIMKHLDKDN